MICGERRGREAAGRGAVEAGREAEVIGSGAVEVRKRSNRGRKSR